VQTLHEIKITILLAKDTLVFAEGENPRGIHILCQGRVKLSMTAVEGRTLIIGVLQPGDVLGLHATISGGPHQFTATTLQPYQLNFVSRNDFLVFLREHRHACLHAAQQLSKECHAAVELIHSIGFSYKMDQRLARFLLRWSSCGDHTNRTIRANFTMTHEEIAQVIGASRETVTRLLARLRRNRIAQIDGTTLLIHNRSALERVVASFR
jgi:CRP/FNR family transcriptional regulator